MSSSLDSLDVGKPMYLINLLNFGIPEKNSKNLPTINARKNNLLFNAEKILLVTTIENIIESCSRLMMMIERQIYLWV